MRKAQEAAKAAERREAELIEEKLRKQQELEKKEEQQQKQQQEPKEEQAVVEPPTATDQPDAGSTKASPEEAEELPTSPTEAQAPPPALQTPPTVQQTVAEITPLPQEQQLPQQPLAQQTLPQQPSAHQALPQQPLPQPPLSQPQVQQVPQQPLPKHQQAVVRQVSANEVDVQPLPDNVAEIPIQTQPAPAQLPQQPLPTVQPSSQPTQRISPQTTVQPVSEAMPQTAVIGPQPNTHHLAPMPAGIPKLQSPLQPQRLHESEGAEKGGEARSAKEAHGDQVTFEVGGEEFHRDEPAAGESWNTEESTVSQSLSDLSLEERQEKVQITTIEIVDRKGLPTGRFLEHFFKNFFSFKNSGINLIFQVNDVHS